MPRGALPEPRYTIFYNGNRIIRVIFEPNEPVVIAPGTKLDFTYEVNLNPLGPRLGR